MKQLVVISGKGGTGKTTIVAGLASLAGRGAIVDCDVDAADLHLVLDPVIEREEAFYGTKIAVRDEAKCLECGMCRDHCRFDAISERFEIDPFHCEGCGVCAYVCPAGAIEMRPRLSGRVFISTTRYGPFVYAELVPGEGTSGKLVTQVKRRGQELAQREGRDVLLVDGSPGIGCPVIASLSGTLEVAGGPQR